MNGTTKSAILVVTYVWRHTAHTWALAVISWTKKTMKILLTTMLIFLLTSCGENVAKEDLPGQYVFTHWGRDTIDIKSDGTYRHYTFASGRQLENTGTWKLNSIGDEVLFENFSFLTDTMQTGNWYSRLRVDGEEIHLMYASDINAYYRKSSNVDSLENDR
ncbi:MAG: hypothetical protein R2804_07780 [Cyclobacteriaceae bacterium]